MATNDFLVVAPGPGANVLTQAQYAARAAVTTGYTSGVAESAAINKSLRQATVMASVIAQTIADVTGADVIDDGTTATILSNLKTALLNSAGHGQCRLSVVSTTSLALKPYNGQNLIINGVVRKIPSAGITITNAGLAALTIYYVYAAWVSNAMILELSTTGHSTHTNGVEVKTGDPTRTLVGMIRTDSGITFVDSTTNKFCINWFNRRTLLAGLFGAGLSTSSISTVEASTGMRCNFLAWGDEGITANYSGSASSNSVAATATAFLQIQMDGTVPGVTFNVVPVFANTASGFVTTMVTTPSEGLHFISLYFLTGGTGTITANATAQLLMRG